MVYFLPNEFMAPANQVVQDEASLDDEQVDGMMTQLVRAKKCVDAKRAPGAKHTASRTSWLHTRKESRDVPVNFS
jgi:hypothetical protein